MNIDLCLCRKSDNPADSLKTWGPIVSGLLKEYLNTDTEILRIRATKTEGIYSHLRALLCTNDNRITVELASDRTKEEKLTVDGKEMPLDLKKSSEDVFSKMVTPFLTVRRIDLDILLLQEQQLQYSSFTASDALKLLEMIVESAEGPVVATITREPDSTVIGQYVSDEKGNRNLNFALGKRKTSLLCGHSSLYAYCQNLLEGTYSHLKAPEYIVGAGAFPIRVNGKLVATIALSGLKEGMDHDVIVSSLCKILNRQVPDIPSVIF